MSSSLEDSVLDLLSSPDYTVPFHFLMLRSLLLDTLGGDHATKRIRTSDSSHHTQFLLSLCAATALRIDLH